MHYLIFPPSEEFLKPTCLFCLTHYNCIVQEICTSTETEANIYHFIQSVKPITILITAKTLVPLPHLFKLISLTLAYHWTGHGYGLTCQSIFNSRKETAVCGPHSCLLNHTKPPAATRASYSALLCQHHLAMHISCLCLKKLKAKLGGVKQFF